LPGRLLRAAAVPTISLGLGTAAACDGGTSLVVDDPDADVTETTDDADIPDNTLSGAAPMGEHYIRFLSEAEGRALITGVVDELAADVDLCDGPGLAGQLLADQPFFSAGEGDVAPVEANVDLLAPHLRRGLPPECDELVGPPVGFEFATDEAGDDEDVSGAPAGLTAAEEAALQALRESRDAAIAVLHAADYPYEAWDYRYWVDDSDRARAEQLVRDTVRVLLEDLRHDGIL
jgi:hypothetical protein